MIFNIESQMHLNVSKTSFAVDTNVLYWMFYGNCSYSNEKRQKIYPGALINLKTKNNVLYTPMTCLFELFSIIEKNEYRLFCVRAGKREEDFRLKEYREITQERERVAKVLEITYKNIKSFMTITQQVITKEHVTQMVEKFSGNTLDVYDKALVDYCLENGVKNIVTDDKDYLSVNNSLNIFTANSNYFTKE